MNISKAKEAQKLLEAGKIEAAQTILKEIIAEPSDFVGTYKIEVQMETQPYFKDVLTKNDKLTTIKRVRDFLQDWISNNIALTTLKLTANNPLGQNFNECYGVFTFKTKSNFVQFFNHLVDNDLRIGKSFKVISSKIMVDIPDPGMSMEEWNNFCSEFHSMQDKKQEGYEASMEKRIGTNYQK